MNNHYLLVEKAQNGDKDAFAQLIKNLENELYRIARTRFYNNSDIEDAVQETILQVLKSIKKLKYPQYFNTWVIKILINNCNNIYNKKTNIPLEEYHYLNEFKTSNDTDNINAKIDFDYIMKNLNYDERIAITLYYMEGYTNKEIGKILETSVGTIKSRISRAKQKIKELYKEEIRNG